MPPTKNIAIGVDLGTSSSCCSYWDPRSKKLQVISQGASKSTIPSCVFYSPESGEVITGNEAVAKQASFPKNTVFGSKRLIGLEVNNRRILKDLAYGPFDLEQTKDNEIAYVIKYNGKPDVHVTPSDVASQILSGLKAQVEQQTGYTPTEVVLSVPANFTSDQRLATLKAAQKSGLNVLRLISEPTAAALAYVEAKTALNADSPLTDREPDYILVYDFGGGTLDCSLVRQTYNGKQEFQVLATSGDPLLGGADLDQDLMKYCVKELCKKFNCDASYFMNDTSKLRRLRTKCKEAKEQLSIAASVDLDLDDFYHREAFTLKLSRVLFQKACFDTLKRALQPIKLVLDEAGVDKSKVKDVVLVGGSSRIPLIQDKLKSFFNFSDISQLARTVNPDECVARGAAIYAATLSSNREQVIPSKFSSDVNSFPLTLDVRVNADGQSLDKAHHIYIPLVQGHSALPTQGTKNIEIPRKYLESVDNIDIALFQADLTDKAPLDASTAEAVAKDKKLRLYKKWTLPYFASAPKVGDFSPYIITVHYKLDENGVLDIFFEDKELNIVIDVNANKDTTNTVVNEVNKQQQKQDLMANYNAMQQKQEEVKKAIAPPPIPKHVLNQISQQQTAQPAAAAAAAATATVAAQPPSTTDPEAKSVGPPPPPPQAIPAHLRQNLPPIIAQQMEQKRAQDIQQPQSFEKQPSLQPSTSLPVEAVAVTPSSQQPQLPTAAAPTPPTPPPPPTAATNKMVEHLNQALAVRDEMIMQLQQQILQLQNTNQRQTAEIEFFKSQSNQDQEYLAYWQDQAEYSAFQLLQLQQQMSKEATSRLSSVQSQYTEQVQQLESELQKKERLLAEEQAKKAVLESKVGEVIDQGVPEEDVSHIRDELGHVHQEYDILNGQYRALYDHYDALAAEKEAVSTELQSTQLKLRDIEQKYDHQRNLYDSIVLKYDQTQEQLKVTQAQFDEYQHDMEAQVQAARDLAGMKRSLEEEAAEVTRKQRQLSEKEALLKQQQEQQEQLFLAQLPPLPPIDQRVFNDSSDGVSPVHSGRPSPPFNKPKFPPPPPHLLKRQPTLQQLPPADSSDVAAAPQSPKLPPQAPHPPHLPPPSRHLPPQQLQPPQALQAEPVSTEPGSQQSQPQPTPPPPPPAPTAGPSRPNFLMDIIKKPQLKKVDLEDKSEVVPSPSSPSSSSAPSSGQNQSGPGPAGPAPPRLMLLSQLQQGKAMLKTASAPAESKEEAPAVAAKIVDEGLMSKISEYRKRVAMDDEEEQPDFDDW